jgi:hypothetical protein
MMCTWQYPHTVPACGAPKVHLSSLHLHTLPTFLPWAAHEEPCMLCLQYGDAQEPTQGGQEAAGEQLTSVHQLTCATLAMKPAGSRSRMLSSKRQQLLPD